MSRAEEAGAPAGGDDAGEDGSTGRDATVVALDARGQRCPLPVINLARLVRDSPDARRIVVLATDPAAAHDIPAWCRMRGHAFVQARDEGTHTAYVIDVLRPSGPAAAR